MVRGLSIGRWLAGIIATASLAACADRMLNEIAVFAQSSTGALYGSVLDPQGRAVANAMIVVRSADLGAQRSTPTDREGAFRMVGLVPGAYELQARTGNLILKRPLRVTISVGSSTQVAMRLSITGAQEHVTVHGGRALQEGNTVAPAVNKTESSDSDFFAGMTVTYLPIRDRDFMQFNDLGAGAHENPEGAGVIVSGQRSSAIVTQVDGTNFNNPLLGGRRGAGDGSFFLPQTVVREFELVRSGVAADVGETNAGLVNIATKEGTNKFHGEAFYTGRPSTLTSKDAFGHSLDSVQDALGGSFGGPIRRNRSFFYAGVEQDFLHAPYFAQFEPQAKGVVIPASLTALQGQVVEKAWPTAGFLRIDVLLNAANTLNVQASADRIRATNVGDGLTRSIATVDYASSLSGQSFWTRAGLTSVLNRESISQLVAAWSADHRDVTPNSTAPEVFINGFGILGGNALGAHLYSSRQLQLNETLLVEHSGTSLAFGGAFAFDPMYEQREENLNGRFDYDSLTGYLSNTARRYQQTFVAGGVRFAGSIREFDLFGNAKLAVCRALALTAGLRWAGQWNPQPSHSDAAIPQTRRIPNDLAQWQPRVGLAWTPTHKMVIRLSSGLYSAPTPGADFHRVLSDNGLETVVADSDFDSELLALTGAETGAPHALSTAPWALTQPHALVVGIDPSFRNPSSLQAAGGVNQEITPKLSLNMGYLHSSTWNLQRRVDENLNAPEVNDEGDPVFPTVRPDPSVGRLLVNQSTAHSSYDAFLLTATSQISRRSQLSANYTLSRTRDDDSSQGPYGIDAAINPYDLGGEKAYSSLDTRHVLNLSAILNLPVGFKLNPLLVARSGAPYTPIIGFDTQNDANDWNDRAVIDGTTTSRNSLRQPAFSDLDLRLVKDFTLKGEGHHLDLFMDVFNVIGAMNRNFGPEAVSAYGLPQSPLFTTGQALFAPDVTRIGGPREIQFTARLVGF